MPPMQAAMPENSKARFHSIYQSVIRLQTNELYVPKTIPFTKPTIITREIVSYVFYKFDSIRSFSTTFHSRNNPNKVNYSAVRLDPRPLRYQVKSFFFQIGSIRYHHLGWNGT